MKIMSLFVLLLLVVVGGILFVNYSNLNKDKINNDNINSQESTIQKIVEKEPDRLREVSFDYPSKNVDIQFKIGDRYIYKSSKNEYEWDEETYTVDEIKTVDGKSCYVVTLTDNTTFREDVLTPVSESVTQVYSFCYDKNTGRSLEVRMGSVTGEVITYTHPELMATNSFFAGWMLSLDDDARWTIDSTIKDKDTNTPSRILVSHYRDDFRVIGREKVNGREAFKVEKRSINLDKNIVEEIDYYFIDTKKRILLKREYYTPEKVKFYEMSLISEI